MTTEMSLAATDSSCIASRNSSISVTGPRTGRVPDDAGDGALGERGEAMASEVPRGLGLVAPVRVDEVEHLELVVEGGLRLLGDDAGRDGASPQFGASRHPPSRDVQ